MSGSGASDPFRYRLNQFAQNLGMQVIYKPTEPTAHAGDWTVRVYVGSDKIPWGTGRARKEKDAKEIAAEQAFHLMCRYYPDRAPFF